MGSPLFKNAQRAFRAEARRQWRNSDFGQAVEVLNSARRRGRLSSSQAREVRRRLSRLRDTGISDVIAQTETGREMAQLARYARGIGQTGVMDYVFSALGPLGDVLQGLLRPRGSAQASVTRELNAARDLLESFGYTVQPPSGGQPKISGGTREQRAQSLLDSLGFQVQPSQEAVPESPIFPEDEAKRQPQRQPARRGPTAPTPPKPFFVKRPDRRQEFQVGGQRMRLDESDALLTGEMIDVVSSNVHSFGFIWNAREPTKGTLKVRFLQKNRGGRGSGPGPLYFYHGVNPAVFESFKRARSKGEFVWDRLRIRGTVSGHQFQYELAGVSQGYVPRKATRYGPNEYLVQRQVRTRGGRTLTSQLDDARVGRATPQRPSMGIPSRGEPNRGTPNRGR